MREARYVYELYRLDWGQIMASAYEYVDAKREWAHHRAKYPYSGERNRKYRNYEAAEFQLWGIANAIGIPMYVMVAAIRTERKYIQRGNWRSIDYERLIVGLDANRREYDDE